MTDKGIDIMDTLQFISSLVASLVWPCVLLITLGLFKDQISSIIKFRHGETEIEFKRDLAKAVVAPNEAKIQRQDLPERVLALLEINPRAAVVDMFTDLEVAMRLVSSAGNSHNPGKASISALATELQNSGRWDSADLSLFLRLQEMRNKLAHGGVFSGGIDASDAKLYATLAHKLTEKLISKSGA